MISPVFTRSKFWVSKRPRVGYVLPPLCEQSTLEKDLPGRNRCSLLPSWRRLPLNGNLAYFSLANPGKLDTDPRGYFLVLMVCVFCENFCRWGRPILECRSRIRLNVRMLGLNFSVELHLKRSCQTSVALRIFVRRRAWIDNWLKQDSPFICPWPIE